MHTENVLRMTPGRTAILDVLGEKRRHPTAEEVLKGVRKKLPGIGLASVYRNHELMFLGICDDCARMRTAKKERN